MGEEGGGGAEDAVDGVLEDGRVARDEAVGHGGGEADVLAQEREALPQAVGAEPEQLRAQREGAGEAGAGDARLGLEEADAVAQVVHVRARQVRPGVRGAPGVDEVAEQAVQDRPADSYRLEECDDVRIKARWF